MFGHLHSRTHKLIAIICNKNYHLFLAPRLNFFTNLVILVLEIAFIVDKQFWFLIKSFSI